MEPAAIVIQGAAEHNLRGVDVTIPKHKLVVLTGVSGSGKSSLAFDTLFAEGQRRYVESLSAYARQFLGQLRKPSYESIRGLSPTIAIEQKKGNSNPRSTVGTVTEVYDYLRVLFARAGVQHCPQCGRPVSKTSAAEVVAQLLGLAEGTRVVLLAPVARGQRGALKLALEEARSQGFVRVRLDGEVVALEELPAVAPRRRHDLDLVVDRVAVRESARARITDSVEVALRHGGGVAVALVTPPRSSGGGGGGGGASEVPSELLFSERNHCAVCDRSFPELSPQLFSFNGPQGMCPSCHGLGVSMAVSPERVVPDPGKTLAEGAVKPWSNAVMNAGSWTGEVVAGVCEALGISRDVPWRDLPDDARRVLLHGSEGPISYRVDHAKRSGTVHKPFEGVVPTLLRRWRETSSAEMRDLYESYMTPVPCAACQGARLREEARHVRVDGATLPELVGLPVRDLRQRLDDLALAGARQQIAADLLREIQARVRFLDGVGLGYLDLGRAAGSLSGGESQRIRLASQIGTELSGVVYVLDEPSIGLHARDNRRLIDALRRLRDLGNTVVVVEHDEETMRAADALIDFGPGAGVHGGRVVAHGTVEALSAEPESVTGRFLSGARLIAVPGRRREPAGWLGVRGARANNLKGLDVDLPLGVMVAVTGVSGAGKSSLVNDIVRPALARELHGAREQPGPHDSIQGLEQLDKLVVIDQQPIGRTPRSNPATYTKAFDEIRRIYASTKEAQAFGYTPGRFSFNVKGGRCETCAGAGSVKVEMHFLADVYVPCEACGGRRFNDATLRVRYRGRTIAEVLELTFDEALDVFTHHKKLARILQTLVDVGLGYLRLGQPSTTLSGGEAQRVKLSRELARVATGRTIYLLDEPSTGLHFADVQVLLGVLGRLVDAGNSVLVIEHNLDIIKTADWVVDLGPDGGAQGGELVAQGSPEAVAAVPASYTGAALRRVLRPC